MAKIIAFDGARPPRRNETVRPKHTGNKGYPNHLVRESIVNQFVRREDVSVRELGRQLRREYGPRFGERTVERMLRDSLRFNTGEAA